MCKNCWIENGSPQLVNQNIVDAVKQIAIIYDHHCVGGNLHCQLDDWNLEDRFFDEYKQYGDKLPDDNPRIVAEKKCFELMKNMTIEERYSALAISEGHVKVDLSKYEVKG